MPRPFKITLKGFLRTRLAFSAIPMAPSAAAKDSYMHRNTFAARMAQIKEILKRVDLSDGRVQQRMLYSCRVFRYYNFYYDKKSAKSLSERLSITQS